VLIYYLTGFLGYLYLGLLVWMLIDCYQREPDRPIWMLVMLFLQPLGVIVYFFARYLPRGSGRTLQRFLGRFQTRDVKRLKIAASQIGNAYHWLQYADKLRELGRYDQAEAAYREALQKEPQNLQVLWGLGLCLEKRQKPDEALELINQLLALDPDYKFGDVSLARGRLLVVQENWPVAVEHLSRHILRWRQPEGLYLLARCYQAIGQSDQAREQLEALLMDLEASPPAIARKQSSWRKKAKRLLRSV